MVLWASLSPSLDASEPEGVIRISVQYIAVSFQTLQSHLDKDPKGKLHEEIFALRKSNKAKIVETMVATGKSGEATESLSCEESIYPTEYDPPELHMAGGQPPEIHHATRSKLKITAWETRDVGGLIEAEPTFSEEGNVNLRFYTEVVSLLRIHNHFSLKDRWGTMNVVFPIFESLRTNQSLQLRPGNFMLVAIHHPKHPDYTPFEDTRIMVFVRADIIKP